VSADEPDGLIARIRRLRRGVPAAGSLSSAVRGRTATDAAAIAGLQTRVAHLEHLVEGLQDSVDREFTRQGKLLAEFQAQVQPAAMNAALTRDARDRGL
jgi:hypothetical protein